MAPKRVTHDRYLSVFVLENHVRELTKVEGTYRREYANIVARMHFSQRFLCRWSFILEFVGWGK